MDGPTCLTENKQERLSVSNEAPLRKEAHVPTMASLDQAESEQSPLHMPLTDFYSNKYNENSFMLQAKQAMIQSTLNISGFG